MCEHTPEYRCSLKKKKDRKWKLWREQMATCKEPTQESKQWPRHQHSHTTRLLYWLSNWTLQCYQFLIRTIFDWFNISPHSYYSDQQLCVRVWSVIDPLSAVNWDVLQPARTSQFMSSLLSSSCSDSGIQYLSVSVYVCVYVFEHSHD